MTTSKDLARRLVALGPIERLDIQKAQTAWSVFRRMNGWRADAPLLTPPSANVKLAKSGELDYGLSLAPARLSGLNACTYKTPNCDAGCVAFAGKGELADVIRARITKTQFLAAYPREFVTLLDHEITKTGATAVRLNVFSDLPWETIAPWLFEQHAGVRFYDYTKRPGRIVPSNYHLTYSASERTPDAQILEMVAGGVNVAVIFDTRRGEALPARWMGARVIDGDANDQRFNDPCGVVVGLRAKGRMRSGNWAMVRKVSASSLAA